MKNVYLVLMCFFSCFGFLNFIEASQYITVPKNGVIYNFLEVDKETDHFTRNVFSDWERETFDVFEQVKNPEGIAIDLGAWIGTTSIWLSKNFKHVIAVEADRSSLGCLKGNLEASSCFNVSICPQPIASKSQMFVFAPMRANENLNLSTSTIKSKKTNLNDYEVKSITLKQLFFDYIIQNEEIKDIPISFIKCDIEGGEETVLEDILHYAYNNACKAFISFHYSWWKDKNISEFEYLFKLFKTNCPQDDICKYIAENPFASLLFEPVKADLLVKKNMPVAIIGFNQPTFIKNMVNQLEKYTSDIIVIDNNSTYPPLLDYYEKEFKYTLLRQKKNSGHTVFKQKEILNLLGELYFVTDPDLKFNVNLPDHFMQDFVDISKYFGVYKVGFALLIDAPDIRTDVKYANRSIKEWESAFWRKKISYPLNSKLQMYSAPIDSTFCLVNERLASSKDFYDGVRVAGDYTCIHIPWHKDYEKTLMPGEYDYYIGCGAGTTWFKINK